MKNQTLTIEQLKKLGKINRGQTLLVKSQDFFRQKYGKASSIEDKSVYTNKKKRALYIAEECKSNDLEFLILLITY